MGFLFKEDLAQKILTGDKTQTRRPVKQGEALVELDGLKTLLTAGGRIKHQQGRDYAVQYGRGKPMCWYKPADEDESARLLSYGWYKELILMQPDLRLCDYLPMRIRLADIWFEDVRQIRYSHARQEGFGGEIDFLRVWCEFYDTVGLEILKRNELFLLDYPNATDLLDDRPHELYQAWVYEFELVEA